MEQLNTISPILIIIFGAFLILLIDLFSTNEKRGKFYSFLSFVTLGIALTRLLRSLYSDVDSYQQQYLFSNALVIDNLYRISSVILIGAVGVLFFYSSRFLESLKEEVGEFYSLFLCCVAGMMILTASNDFITLFLALELLSISTYILTGYSRRRSQSTEAAMKYFIIGAFSTGFILYGMTLLYGVSGTIYLDQMGPLLQKQKGAELMVLTGMTLLMVGFCFKVGAVPFHMWVPDVYQGASTPVTAFMSVTVKVAVFTTFIRFLFSVVVGYEPASLYLSELLTGIAVATMVIGNLFALTQTSVKRMLAYSSVAHSGYAMIGLVLFTAHKDVNAASATLFYLLSYTIMTIGAFSFILFAMKKEGNEAENYEDFAGLAKRRPWAAFGMSIFMLSLAGFPPTGGFFAKFYLFRSALAQGYYALIFIGVFTSVVSLYYYLNVMVMMYMKEGKEEAGETVGPYQGLFSGMNLTVCSTAILTLILGLFPTTFLEFVLKWSQGFPGL